MTMSKARFMDQHDELAFRDLQWQYQRPAIVARTATVAAILVVTCFLQPAAAFDSGSVVAIVAVLRLLPVLLELLLAGFDMYIGCGCNAVRRDTPRTVCWCIVAASFFVAPLWCEQSEGVENRQCLGGEGVSWEAAVVVVGFAPLLSNVLYVHWWPATVGSIACWVLFAASAFLSAPIVDAVAAALTVGCFVVLICLGLHWLERDRLLLVRQERAATCRQQSVIEANIGVLVASEAAQRLSETIRRAPFLTAEIKIDTVRDADGNTVPTPGSVLFASNLGSKSLLDREPEELMGANILSESFVCQEDIPRINAAIARFVAQSSRHAALRLRFRWRRRQHPRDPMIEMEGRLVARRGRRRLSLFAMFREVTDEMAGNCELVTDGVFFPESQLKQGRATVHTRTSEGVAINVDGRQDPGGQRSAGAVSGATTATAQPVTAGTRDAYAAAPAAAATAAAAEQPATQAPAARAEPVAAPAAGNAEASGAAAGVGGGEEASESRRVQVTRQQLQPLNLRVLFIDDELVNRMLGRRFLQRLGCTTELLEDGTQALEAIENAEAHGDPIQVVLMDIVMEHSDGADICAMLRRHDVNCPIVAMTAATQEKDVQRYREARFDLVLAKPFDIYAMQQALREAIAITEDEERAAEEDEEDYDEGDASGWQGDTPATGGAAQQMTGGFEDPAGTGR